MRRPVDKLLDDMLQAAAVAAEIVRRGREGFESERDDIPRLRGSIERYRG